MRKWVWMGTACTVLAMAGMFLAADRAVRYPNSFLGRCAVSVKNLAFGFGACHETKPVATVAQKSACKAAPAPEPEAFEPLAVEPSCPLEVETPALPTLPPPLSSAEESDAPVPAMPVAVEDENVTGRCMPYADQDEDLDFEMQMELPGQDAVPVEDADVQPNSPMNLWHWISRWFVPETAPSPQTPIQGITDPVEESEPLPELPGLREDPHHDHHYPSCPYTGNSRCPFPQPRYVPPMTPVGPPSPPNNATPNN